MDLYIAAAIAVVALVIALRLGRDDKASRSDRICRLFGLDPQHYELIGSDLGGGKGKVFLRGHGVMGVPDAVFRKRDDGSIVVGEAKSRRWRGSISTYETFQVTLYLGVCRRRYRRPVSGLIRYSCGTCVPVPFHEDVFWSLIKRIPEYRSVARQIRRASA